jgi:hypothetical protein
MENFDEPAKRLAIPSDPCFRPLFSEAAFVIAQSRSPLCASSTALETLERASALLRRADVTDVDAELQRLSAAVIVPCSNGEMYPPRIQRFLFQPLRVKGGELTARPTPGGNTSSNPF